MKSGQATSSAGQPRSARPSRGTAAALLRRVGLADGFIFLGGAEIADAPASPRRGGGGGGGGWPRGLLVGGGLPLRAGRLPPPAPWGRPPCELVDGLADARRLQRVHRHRQPPEQRQQGEGARVPARGRRAREPLVDALEGGGLGELLEERPRRRHQRDDDELLRRVAQLIRRAHNLD